MAIEQRIVEAVRSVIGDGPALLHEPFIPAKARKYVNACIESGYVSAGPWVKMFEEKLCEITGAQYAITTCNGTCALEAALATELIRGNKEHLKIPSLTFIATPNAALHAGRIFWFTEPEDANLPVHILGMPSKAKGRIHDAAQALGSTIDKDYTAAIYSFNQNKIITTGGGGAIVTNDFALGEMLMHLTTTARVPHPYKVEHDSLSWNYRMGDLNAAVGFAQLEVFDTILNAKAALANKYQEAFRDIEGVSVWRAPPGSNHWLTAIQVDKAEDCDLAIKALHAAGYMVRMLPTPMHMLELYKGCDKDDMTRTEDIWSRTICLPSSPKLGLRHA